MLTLTAPEPVRTFLQQAKSLTEIRDAAGNVIGFFAPVSVERAHLYAQAASQIDPQEMHKRKEAGGKTHTTQEVLDHLKALETP